MIKYRCAIWSAILSMFGTILLVISFQATSTNFLLVTTKGGDSALCVGNRAMFALTEKGLSMNGKCPEGVMSKPTAVVNTERPKLAIFGLFIIITGFVLQLLSINKPKQGKETGERKTTPLDPCPCGSGRKYRKCCGKQR